MYVDGNTHGGEITGGEAALHLVHTLATQYGKDPLITEALDKITYYVIPRVNPDGAEAYLTGVLPKNPNPQTS
jgi:murein tripeptide amidase MpaA